MAISHVQPLRLFFASLLSLPALYAIKFEYCKDVANNFGNITYVTTTYPGGDNGCTVSIYVGTTNKDKFLDDGNAVLELTVSKSGKGDLRFYDLINCAVSLPIGGGRPVLFEFTNIPLQHNDDDHESFDKATLHFFSKKHANDEEMCITFNPSSCAESAAVSA